MVATSADITEEYIILSGYSVVGGPINSYESCSVAFEAKNGRLPESKKYPDHRLFFRFASIFRLSKVIGPNESNPDGETSLLNAQKKFIHGVTDVSFPM